MKERTGDNAEQEAVAQLEIIRTLRKLPSRESRKKVIEAIRLIIEADLLVPGILAAVGGVGKERKP